MASTTTKSITAENTFSDSIWVRKTYYNVSVQGTFVATVFLQRSYDGGTTYYDVASYTTPTETYGICGEIGVSYRLGVKTGGFTSGTILTRLGC